MRRGQPLRAINLLFMLAGLLVVLVGMGCVPAAQGAVSLSHTRLVMSADQPEVTPRVANEGSQPVLLQMWFDAGDRDADPQSLVVPFLVLPPIMRLEAGDSQRLRILFTGHGKLPADRESVYWLNVLEIPPKSAQPHVDQLQISFRTRIKLFYRPAGVAADAQAHQALRFEWRPVAAHGVLRITNPTALHQTLLDLRISQDRDAAGTLTLTPPDMVAPGAHVDVPIAQAGKWGDGARVWFSVIDDAGAVVHGSTAVIGATRNR